MTSRRPPASDRPARWREARNASVIRRCHDMPFGARACCPKAVRAFGCGRPSATASSSCAATAPVRRGAADASAGRVGGTSASCADASASTATRFASTATCGCPIPASRCNPDDVHGASVLVDPRAHSLARRRLGAAARGTRRWSTNCTSAPSRREGTFVAAHRAPRRTGRAGHHRDRADAGGRFPGRRNWGYDGVLPFAPDASLRHARRPEGAGRRRRTRAG